MSLSSTKSKYFLDHITENEFLYIKNLADDGQALAQFILACYYLQGVFVEKSLDEASKYFQRAADHGFKLAWQFLGDIHKSKGSEDLANRCYKNALDYHMELAAHGHVEEQIIVGMFFEKGIGTPQDLKRAFEYYKEAAKQQNSHGQYRLGYCYEQGIGVDKSIENAIHYYKLSAAQNYPLAAYSLALCLLNHSVQDIQDVQIVHHLKEIIQNNSALDPAIKADCYYCLGGCFEKGRGTTSSYSDALHYYKLASNLGNSSASARLGIAYLNGELGLKHSDKKSFHYHRLATDQGDLDSALIVGHFFEHGVGSAQSLESAITYYELAEKNGDHEGHSRANYCRKKLEERSGHKVA